MQKDKEINLARKSKNYALQHLFLKTAQQCAIYFLSNHKDT